MRFNNILVLCRGNICRSPMAEYFLKKAQPHLHIESAGIFGLIGHHADQKAINSMRLKGIDMSAHIAKKVRPDIIKKSDLILVMSVYQKKYIENTWPLSKGKTYRLGHWQSMDILDPYQHNQEVFNETCYLIQNCVEDWTRII